MHFLAINDITSGVDPWQALGVVMTIFIGSITGAVFFEHSDRSLLYRFVEVLQLLLVLLTALAVVLCVGFFTANLVSREGGYVVGFIVTMLSGIMLVSLCFICGDELAGGIPIKKKIRTQKRFTVPIPARKERS